MTPEQKELLRALSPNPTYEAAKLAVPNAISQLEKSQRGRLALKNFRQHFAGSGLDSENWKALAVLCCAEGCNV
jgi:hypothetical protein